MKFILNVRTDNEAFEGESLEVELPRILRMIANDIEQDGVPHWFTTILDSNGNDVGRYALKPDDYK